MSSLGLGARNSPRRKHLLVTRCCHWLNVPLLAGMLWSGLWIFAANDAYGLRVGPITVFHLLPGAGPPLSVAVPRLAAGMAWHFLLAWFFLANGVVYVLHALVRGEWRHFAPTPGAFRDAWRVVLADLRRRAHPPVRGKFNGAQRLAYLGALALAAGAVVTGLAIAQPVQLRPLDALLGGYAAARAEHVLLAMGLVLFILLHLAQVARAGWRHLCAMLTGFEPENAHD